jgi:hypothetical protein
VVQLDEQPEKGGILLSMNAGSGTGSGTRLSEAMMLESESAVNCRSR